MDFIAIYVPYLILELKNILNYVGGDTEPLKCEIIYMLYENAWRF
jgi:hypothetical protein